MIIDCDDRSEHPQPRVLLLSMPWAPLDVPSHGLGILKARLREEAIPCTVSHLNIFLLKALKPESYEHVCKLFAVNDFLFTDVLDPEVTSEQLDVLRGLPPVDPSVEPQKIVDHMLRIRDEAVPQYLADCLDVIDRSDATMVGFTCMYDQTIASAALAKLIKQRYPEKLLVFGGYAVEKPTGLQMLWSFPFIDVVLFGEGEDRIASLAEASVEPGKLETIPGIAFRDASGSIRDTQIGSLKVDLDRSPVPDYDDFFRDIDRLKLEDQVEVQNVSLPVESARGCWWGQLHHCVFCGIDDETMQFRCKSPERVLHLLSTLRERHGDKYFQFTDYIMPRLYFKTLFRELSELSEKYLLHWETKSNLKEEEVRILKAAGVRSLQPGIESFSTSVLRKMDKGVTGIQNVLTLKLLMEYDIGVVYNILFGFPGDEPDEYLEMCEKIPLLYHLYPPDTYGQVQTTRYAPLQTSPERFSVSRPLVRHPTYNIIFSKLFLEQSGFDLDEYCYIFDLPYEPMKEQAYLYSALSYQCNHWRTNLASREVRLSYEFTKEGVEFVDSRAAPEGRVLQFGPEHAAVYAEMGNSILSMKRLVGAFAGRIDAARVASIVGDFSAERLLFEERSKFLGLAFPSTCYERWRELLAERERETERSPSEGASPDGDQIPPRTPTETPQRSF
jgi:ribosomal peptide maturation radical SAM protein 1